ncbi:MAG: hypothetical protein KBD39_08485 [Sterolibacterium sp.]|nr:hypothetical protein [Sterolibacterium sp.]MBP9800139.1 hypothetical protein [Sterolibacterium sp.]
MQDTLTMPLALRQDLRLYESGSDAQGAPTWVIQDPVSNRFYRIGWLEYECLLRWPNDPQVIAREIEQATPLAVAPEQVAAFGRFLDQHQLLLPSAQRRTRMIQQARQPGWRHWRWWLHHYLFIRIPLLRPQAFLASLTAQLAPLFSPWTPLLIIAASLTGLLMVARQWETFSHSILESLTPSGMVGFALALAVSKGLHELGHAVVATRQGVRVAHMGVAFLVMWPMLYTDTGESWRLHSHRQRLAISIAGVAVEMALAGLATLAWALLDDGALRQAALYLATTGWVLSLALNLSPFMRFDGYFILSDLLDFPNLHERSGALARTWLRRLVLGLTDDWPENLPRHQHHLLIAFALATWLYRLVVFLGIAWMVYAFFFKALGIFLMLVEIVWFVARPVWQEAIMWWRRWPEVSSGRRRRLYAMAGLFGLLVLLPWRLSVPALGVAHVERQQRVYTPFPARLVQLHPAGKVAAGTSLALFETPDLTAREVQARAGAEALERTLTGLLAKTEGIAQQSALTQRMDERLAEIRATREEIGRLRIAAEFAGEWRDVSDQLHPGSWVGIKEPLGVLIDPHSWVVDAYVEQRLIERVEPGATATFLAEGGLHRIPAVVVDIDRTRTQRLPYAMLDSRHGGPILTRPEGQGSVPVDALYHVRLRLIEFPGDVQEWRGSLQIEGQARSLVWEILKGSLAALVRESGF